ncbi:hypothetical protein [Roseomonas sp. BN140053]|uniref:hypothetical protein n=1 Tax=Roseomonas sp. BN140053 TaxID=3391898 RepID=UPI0039EB129F
MMRKIAVALLLVGPAACAPQQRDMQLIPSARSAVELRAMQSRTIDGDRSTIYRGTIATLHDLGYRVTRAEPSAGTVSAVKLNRLYMTVVVQPRTPSAMVVRANAAVAMSISTQQQVDVPEFYQQNFFAPLAGTLGTQAFALPAGTDAPEQPALPTSASPTPQAAPPVSQPSSSNRQQEPVR